MERSESDHPVVGVFATISSRHFNDAPEHKYAEVDNQRPAVDRENAAVRDAPVHRLLYLRSQDEAPMDVKEAVHTAK